MRIGALAFAGALMLYGQASFCFGADAKRDAAPDYHRDVLPIFEAKCLRCHGVKRRDAKLDMRTLEAMLTGGVSGPALKPGNAQKSLLIELLHYNEMPPKKELPKITKEELELLRKWIDAMPASTASPAKPTR